MTATHPHKSRHKWLNRTKSVPVFGRHTNRAQYHPETHAPSSHCSTQQSTRVYIWLPSADIASIFWEEFKIHSSPRNLCRFTAIQQYYFTCIFATYCQYHFLRFVVPCTEPTSLDVFSIQHMYHMHITHDTNICTKHTVECTPSKPIHKTPKPLLKNLITF